MKQKIYNCTFRFKGAVIHTMPMTDVTKHELTFLAFQHGGDAIADLKFVGEREMFVPTGDRENPMRLVRSDMDEFKRIAAKYDDVVNAGRVRKAVENCFHVRLEDFDSIVAEVDARDSVARAAEEAEAKAAIAAGDQGHKVVEEQLAEATKATSIPPVGQRFAQQARGN